MIAEGRLLRCSLLASLALHLAAIGFLAHRGLSSSIPIDDLRVVAVGTYTPSAPRLQVSLPRELERRPPAPRRVVPPSPPVARPVPRSRIPAMPRLPAFLRRILPQPVVRTPQPIPLPVARNPQPVAPPRPVPVAAARPPRVPAAPPVRAVGPTRVTPPAPAPARPAPVPTRLAQAPPQPTLPVPAPQRTPGNSGGRLHLGTPSAAGTVPVGAGGSTPGGHVPNERAGGTGTGSGDVSGGRGSAEPARTPVPSRDPGPQVPVAPRQPDPPPPPPTERVAVCKRSGLRPGHYCAETVTKAFPSDQVPQERCDACKPPPPAPDPETHRNRSAESRDARLKHDEKLPDVSDLGLEGTFTVTVGYTVDETGRVTNVKVVRSSGNKQLDRYAERTIRACTYTPAEQNGEARSVQKTRDYRFVLEN